MIRHINKYYSEVIIGLIFLYLSFAYFRYAYSNIVLVVLLFLFLAYSISVNVKPAITIDYNKIQIIIVVPLFLGLLSVVFSDNKVLALTHVWHILPILVIPLVLLSLLTEKKQILNGVKVFIVISLLGLGVTLYNLLELNISLSLFSSEIAEKITIIQHPYFGIYQLLAFLFLIEFFRNRLHTFLFFLLAAAFSFGVFLSTSRISYILYILILFLYFLKYFSRTSAIVLILVIAGLLAVFVKSNDSIAYKFSRSFVYKTSPRLIIWNNSYQYLKNSNNPIIGVSTDYYNEGVKDPYWLRGYADDLKDNYVGLKGYNSHNQYIEYILLNGVFGVFYILLMLYTFLIAITKKNVFLISLALIICVFSFTETILHRQYGIILYAVIMPIIYGLAARKNEGKSI